MADKNYNGSPHRRSFDQEISFAYYQTHTKSLSTTAKNIDLDLIEVGGVQRLSSRQGFFICNNSPSGSLYVGFSPDVSATFFAFPPIPPSGALWVAASGGVSRGADTGIWIVGSATGMTVTITEVS